MDDTRYMRMALEQAMQGDEPFGAVIVADGNVLAQAENRVLRNNDPMAHAEITAIREALAVNPAALKGATMYASFEPCPMCAGACLHVGISRIVYSTDALVVGWRDERGISCEELIRRSSLTPVEVVGGVLLDESLPLYKK